MVKQNLFKKISIFFLFLWIIGSCVKKKDPIQVSDIKYYTPIENRFIEYKVNEIIYRGAVRFDTSYWLKETVSDPFIDVSGNQAFTLKRYKKGSELAPYLLDSVWNIRQNGSHLVRYENNVPYVSLINPISENSSWNGNMYNTQPARLYKIQEYGLPYKQLSHTLKINQEDDSTLLVRNFAWNIWGRDIGLIDRYYRHLVFSSASKDFGKGIVISGRVVSQQYIRHGQE